MKRVFFLLLLIVIPFSVFANYQPDANKWELFSKNDYHEFYINKKPVNVLNKKNDMVSLQTYVQLVQVYDIKLGVKSRVMNVIIYYDELTGERLFQTAGIVGLDEQGNPRMSYNKPSEIEEVKPGSAKWTISEMIIQKYKSQENVK